MTLYEYLKLPENEQYEIVFNKGVFLDNRIVGKRRFNLYAVDMFFVEVEYDNDLNKVVNAIAFKTGPILDNYGNLEKEF